MEVTSRRSETSQVFANPDGSFTQDSYALPQWVRQGGRLVDIDTTLKQQGDGSYAARATEVGVEFSGGGDGPLVTVVKDGRSMAWSWPDALPEPAVDGDTATYPEVLPGVDLKLKAGSAGFSQLLVVKNAEAATHPELQSIALKLQADGLDITADEHGNLQATNPAGQEVFTAPTPLMWDSSTAPAARIASAPTSRTADAPPAPADEFEAPHGANDAPMDLRISGDELTLIPDAGLLTGEGTRYPVYIDPSVSGSRYAWAIAYKKYPDSSFYNGNGWRNSDGSYGTSTARAGYENMTNGLARSYFRMRTANLWNTDKVVSRSTFRIKNTWSWSCTAKPVELWRTDPIGSSTTWNDRPTRREQMDTVTDAKGWSSSCPAGNLAFDVTKGAKDAAANEWDTITLELAAASESDVYGWKKFDAKTATLSTTYNTRPNVPSGLDTYPVSTNNEYGCGDRAPYQYIGNTDFYLRAKVSDPDGGTVKAVFRLWPTGHGDDGVILDESVSVTSGTIAKVKVPKALLAEHAATASGNFSWKVKADDGTLASDWNPPLSASGCRFVFDADRASTPPTVTSSQFPDGSDGWPASTGKARTEGTFTISSGGVTDVTAYEYWTDWDSTVRTVTAGSIGGSATVKITPLAAGSHALFVRSIDQAGNKSDRGTYMFYANSPGTPDAPGDLNGDTHPDIYGVRTDGSLRLYPGQGNGKFAPYTTAGSTSFDGASITHRGDWTGDGYEDLIAAQGTNGAKDLYLYPNNGLGYACTSHGETTDGASAACTDKRHLLGVFDPANNHWSGAQQLLAIGDVDGPLDVDDDGTPDIPGHPDLLVKEGDLLWLYFGSPDYYLDSSREPVLIGDGSWSDYDLAAPGDVDGDGRVDLVARNRTAGDLRLYPGTGPNGEGLGAGSTHLTIQATGWKSTIHPLLASGGDADHDGQPDLWASSPETGAELKFYPGLTASGLKAPTVVGNTGWLNFRTLS
ncbi:FG-GAP-like repeat-containing protein [Streptomyces poonensis]|uniref:FG-GAP-like repeat-containing protein n=2 Tax=Streptomyces poonensis TaxID=68255 RepID=UPI0022F3443C|nr:FG-GAP-like repeat-containing protein [Streptomyces poonensis]